MKRIIMGAAGSILAASLAYAQTPTPPGAAPSTSVGAPASPNPLGAGHDGGKAAASGDTNQAVATTGANADHPAHGRNSFTMKQARKRISGKGYTQVTGLKKDSDGVWRGTAMKDGQSVQVWLDYKGNVGQQS